MNKLLREWWRRVCRVLSVAFVLCGIPTMVSAQKVLLTQVPLQLYDAETGRLEATWPGRGTASMFTADGRYVLTPSGMGGLQVIDITSGALVDVPISFQPLRPDPRAVAMYGLTGGPLSFGVMIRGTLARVDASGLTAYEGCPAGTAIAVDVSGDGALLFEHCDSGDLAVLDSHTGRVIRTLPLGQGVSFAAMFDGATLVVTRPVAGGAIELLDSTTGATLASTVVPGSSTCTPFLSAFSLDRTTLIVSCTTFGLPLPEWSSRVLSAPTLTWGATLEGLSRQFTGISPDNRVAFSSWSHRLNIFGNVQRHDLTTGLVTASVPIMSTIAVSYAPLPPAATAAVTGRQVDLHWTLSAASPDVTSYIVEVGTASGLANVGMVAVGLQSSLSVPAAPSGRYYVRVRAKNASGTSAPSSELIVDVPYQ